MKKTKALTCLFFVFCLMLSGIFAEESFSASVPDNSEDTSGMESNLESNDAEANETASNEEEFEIKGKDFKRSTSFKSFLETTDLVLQFSPALYLNPNKYNSENTIVSAPSPVVYPVTVGVLWPNYTFIAIQPTLSFFMMNHLFYDGLALPAEIENRTTTTLSFMLNIPAVLTLYLPKSRFQLEAGFGIFMRFGLRSSGVSEDDYGYSGSAGEDVKLINQWFWNNLHWFYFTTSGSWLYNATEKLKLGPSVDIWLPLGSLFTEKNTQGMIISLGLKICR